MRQLATLQSARLELARSRDEDITEPGVQAYAKRFHRDEKIKAWSSSEWWIAFNVMVCKFSIQVFTFCLLAFSTKNRRLGFTHAAITSFDLVCSMSLSEQQINPFTNAVHETLFVGLLVSYANSQAFLFSRLLLKPLRDFFNVGSSESLGHVRV